MQLNFYAVTAKCGHVGKRYYYEGVFYEIAKDGKEAAEIVRYRPRVKHHNKYAILSVKKLSKEEYLRGVEEKKSEIYFQCDNIQEQGLYWSEISQKIFEEPQYLIDEESKPKHKKPYKREAFNWKQIIWEIA